MWPYHVYACQNVVETCWKLGVMIMCYLLIFLFLNHIKTAAKFMRNESVKRPACAPSRGPSSCMLCHSIYLQVIKVYWFKLFDKPGLLCWLVSDYGWITTLFRSSYRKPKHFRSLCRLRILLKHWSYSDFFCKDLHKTLKYIDEFPE